MHRLCHATLIYYSYLVQSPLERSLNRLTVDWYTELSRGRKIKMNEDPLVFIPVEKWSGLQEIFKSDFPRNLSAYSMLETQRRWLENGTKHDFKVYCPYGEFANGMVAFNRKANVTEIVIQCPTDDTSKIEEAMKRTKLINWDEFITIPFAPHNISTCLKRLNIDRPICAVPGERAFMVDINSPLYTDVNIPPDVTFEAVLPKHVELINRVWPHRYSGSERYFELLIENDCGFGLCKNNELISWVFINEAGNLLHVYTLEEHRRQGYAELLLKLVVNDQLKKKRYVIAYCVKGNTQACRFYAKLNFTSFDPVAWFNFNKP